MSDSNDYILPVDQHNAIVDAAYRKRGFTADEAAQATRFCEMAAWQWRDMFANAARNLEQGRIALIQAVARKA